MRAQGLLLARKGSVGLPGKNRRPFRGKPSFRYGLDAALAVPAVDRVFVSTDDEGLLAELAGERVHPLLRPAELARSETLMLDVIRYELDRIEAVAGPVDVVVVLLANSVTVTSPMIAEALRMLAARPDADSVVPVSAYPQWSPYRALRMSDDGLLAPWLDRDHPVSSNRQAAPTTYFACNSFFAVRRRAIDVADESPFSSPWAGRVALPLVDPFGGLDVDTESDLYAAEAWWALHDRVTSAEESG